LPHHLASAEDIIVLDDSAEAARDMVRNAMRLLVKEVLQEVRHDVRSSAPQRLIAAVTLA